VGTAVDKWSRLDRKMLGQVRARPHGRREDRGARVDDGGDPMIDVEKLKTSGHARGARRVEGTGITDLRPLADSLDTYARQIHSIAEIIRSIEKESAEQPTEAPHEQHASTLSAVGWRRLPVISNTLNRTLVIEARAAPVVNTISPEAIYQNILGAREVAERAIAEARAIERAPESHEPRGSRRVQLMRETSSLIVALTILIALTSPLT
jgi:hypothetical protein